MSTDTEPMPDRATGVLDALNIAFQASDYTVTGEPIDLASFLAVAFRETAQQMLQHGAWLLKHHKKGAVGLNKSLALAAEELCRRADTLDTLAGTPTELASERTERDAALLRATADDFTPGGPKAADVAADVAEAGQRAPGECGATWMGQGFDPCILDPSNGHTVHVGLTSKWPRDSAPLASGPPTSQTVAYLKGETDELGTEPLVFEANAGDHVVNVMINTATGEEVGRELVLAPAQPLLFDQYVKAGAEALNSGKATVVELSLNTEASIFPGAYVETGLSTPVSFPVGSIAEAVKLVPEELAMDPMQPDPFSDPVSNGGRPYWLPEPQPVAFVPPDFPRPLAVHQSDIKLAEECGLALRLKYRDRVKPVPTWWNEGGHAFHLCIEVIERNYLTGLTGDVSAEDAQKLFNAQLDYQIRTVTEETGFDKSYWRAANKGTEGEAWWRENGSHMVRDYATWSAKRHAEDWSIAQVAIGTPGNPEWMPALEAQFSYPDPLTGILREGTLDQIWIREAVASSGFSPGYEVELIDPKSWRKPDSDPLQLKFYAGAVASLLPNVPIASLRAAYYDGRAGATTDYIDPETALSEEEVSYRTAMVDAMHATNVYPANPGTEYGKPCGICEFRYACPIMARRDAA